MKIVAKVVNVEIGEFVAKTGDGAGELQTWQRIHLMDEDDDKPSVCAVPKALHDVCKGLQFGDEFEAVVRFVAGGSYEGRPTSAKISLVKVVRPAPFVVKGPSAVPSAAKPVV